MLLMFGQAVIGALREGVWADRVDEARGRAGGEELEGDVDTAGLDVHDGAIAKWQALSGWLDQPNKARLLASQEVLLHVGSAI